jgi:peptide deformylase
MYDTLFAFRAAGLSAVQVGEHKRVIVYLDSDGSPKALINPFIVRETVDELPEVIASTEGCLSFPGVHEVITKKRVGEVLAEGVTETGEKIQVFLTDQQAIAVQHEIDHLNGVLFTDHMGPTARRLALKRLRKVEKRIAHAKENFQKYQASRGRAAA